MAEIKTQVVCDGVRVDRNVIPAYLTQILSGQSTFTVESAYYSGKGEVCQSGSCGKRITNVYVLKDAATGLEYHVGCECIRKYGEHIEHLVSYWKNALEKAKRSAIWQAKKANWASEKDARKKKSIEEHTKELEFIHKYQDIKASPFLESIERIFENGWQMSDKQKAVFDKIMAETDFVKLEEQSQKDHGRFEEILQIIQVLDQVSMGYYPGSEMYHSIRGQFAKNGAVSDKQLEVLKGLIKRFNKQVEKKELA